MTEARLNIDAIIEPPKTLLDAIEYLCKVLSYDTQGWITGLTPEGLFIRCGFISR